MSGDLIQGVGLGAPSFEQELAQQYRVAHDFLVSLTERLLNGDRSRVIIVPGNHDIDWNVAFSAMEVVAEDALPKGLPGALYEPGSPYRWDWKSRRLYRIKDEAKYRARLAAFWDFFERFYDGADGLLRVHAWSDANLYSLGGGEIAVAAFNSCAGNDCFAFHGEIPRDAVGQAYLDLRDLGPWRLRIAVWHHDVEGPPHRADYMNVDIVRGMIGRGFRLGLYGHQHHLQVTPQRAHMLTEETMAIASAGSLCAGRRELPTGALRGYSIVEIRDEYNGARVHVREMSIANSFTRAVLREFGGRSYVDLDWTTPVDAGGRPEDPIRERRVATLRRAEDALRGRDSPREALALLDTIDIGDDAFARRLLVEAATSTGDPLGLPAALGPPQTIEELVLLVDSHLAVGQREQADALLVEHGARLELPEPVRTDLNRRLLLSGWSHK